MGCHSWRSNLSPLDGSRGFRVLTTCSSSCSDLPLLLDEWATSLFRELDYRQEAANGARFKALYGTLDRVFVPDMYQDLTSRRVLVMEWVAGRRLRTSSQGAASS